MDPVSRLSCAALHHPQHSGPDHSKNFEVDVIVDDIVYGTGSGHSKQVATKAAARDALNRLGIIE